MRTVSDWEVSAKRANQLLGPLQGELEAGGTDTVKPILHVVGPPRSGTTLAMQLIASCTDIGYIDNTAAAFWEAPAYGLLLSRHLNAGARATTWRSQFGQTKGPTEPHEFGRFWLRLLGYRSMAYGDRLDSPIDWEAAKRRLASMTTAAQRPIVFKSFVAAWHLDEMSSRVGPLGVVRIHRDAVDTATSLLALRDFQSGNRTIWASIRPPLPDGVDSLTPAEQVVQQVIYSERELDRQTSTLANEAVLDVNYVDLCSNPQGVLERIASLVTWLEETLTIVNSPPVHPISRADASDPDHAAVTTAWNRQSDTNAKKFPAVPPPHHPSQVLGPRAVERPSSEC